MSIRRMGPDSNPAVTVGIPAIKIIWCNCTVVTGGYMVINPSCPMHGDSR